MLAYIPFHQQSISRLRKDAILTVKTVAVTPDPQVKIEFEIPQEPLEDFRVNPEPAKYQRNFHFMFVLLSDSPDAVAVYVAHVPVVNQVAALIRHPCWFPLVYAFKYPDPEKVPLPPVGLEVELDPVVVVVGLVVVVKAVVMVGAGLPDFGRYLIPVEGQVDVDPTGEVGSNVPV